MLTKFTQTLIVCIVFVLFSSALHSQSLAQTLASDQKVQTLIEHWANETPTNMKKLDEALKKAEKQEKKFKDISDKAFQDNFDAVFGPDKLKPSSALDYLKVFEAVSASDYETAGKLSTDLLISAYAPGLGQYVSAMKYAHKKIEKQITSWGNEVYKTKTFEYFRRDLTRMTKYESMLAANPEYSTYVPSYMVGQFTRDARLGQKMQKLQAAMIAREEQIFRNWSEGDNDREMALQFGDLKKKSWWDFGSTGAQNSKWIVALGADPSSFGNLSVERKMFNFFLYEMTEPRRQEYMQDLIEYYIEPIIKEEARREKRRLSAAINAAINETISVFDQQQAINEVETKIDEEEKNELETNEEIIGDTPTLPTSNDLDLTEFIEVSPMTPTANTPFGEDSLEKIVTKDTKNAEANDITYEITEEDIIADLIASDKRGELSPEAQIEYADLLAKGYASEAATESVDEWDDINAIDDLIVSDINRDDEWAIRDEMASQHQRDVDQSQLKTRRQFASVEAQRAEKRRVEEEKRRKRAADMAAISAGLGQIANQIRQAEQQSSFETQQRQVRIDQNASSYKNSAAERNKFINSCLDSIQNTSTGFRANDPHANRIACSEKFNAHKNATTGNGQTYLERLEVQRRSGQQNYSTRPNARQVNSQSQLKAKADCSCYEAGKKAGAFSKNSKNQMERPSECAPMYGMGNLPPWRSGFYDGRDNSETHSKDSNGKNWCRFGK